jgi:serine/threonine-protein kinase HipA
MAKNEVIQVICFDKEIGTIGMDENKAVSYFQYHPEFLESNRYLQLIPPTGIIQRIPSIQVFKKYNNETFRGLPPIFADSLPDMFGNIVFKTWLENSNRDFKKITALEQLAYVADRGMGALTYQPKKEIPKSGTIDLNEIVEVLKEVVELKKNTTANNLNHAALLNIFKIGTSAGGARPKILIAEDRVGGKIFPGDLDYSSNNLHYIVKLNLDEEGYNKELVEYSYYQTAIVCGIDMMESKLIDNRHFATQRFDRVNGEKKHVLTASGMTGWDFKDPAKSSYENLFDLSLFLKLPHAEIEEIFRRMVFNIVFANHDDHLKNHSFIYDTSNDRWHLSPAYDLTYSLNPLVNFKRTSRALSINNKRVDILHEDVLAIAEKFTIRNVANIIEQVQAGITYWQETVKNLDIPSNIVQRISNDFVKLR